MQKLVAILFVSIVTATIIILGYPNLSKIYSSWKDNWMYNWKINSKCTVSNNSDFEVNLGRFFYEHSYSDKFMSVDEGGIGYGSVEVSGPQISPYRDGSLSFRVSLDVFDKKSWTKIDSEHIRVNVEDHKGSSKSYGREELEFYLEPGEYVISINEAICEY